MKKTASKYPEHRKLEALAGKNQVVGAFIEWLHENGRKIAEPHEHADTCRSASGHYACGYSRGELVDWNPPGFGAYEERVIAVYFDLNAAKLASEKDRMLAELRSES